MVDIFQEAPLHRDRAAWTAAFVAAAGLVAVSTSLAIETRPGAVAPGLPMVYLELQAAPAPIATPEATTAPAPAEHAKEVAPTEPPESPVNGAVQEPTEPPPIRPEEAMFPIALPNPLPQRVAETSRPVVLPKPAPRQDDPKAEPLPPVPPAATEAVPARPEKARHVPSQPKKPKATPVAKTADKPPAKPRKDTGAKPAQLAKPSAAPSSESKASTNTALAGAAAQAEYERAVLSKIAHTPRKTAQGKGTVVVGFGLAPNGGLLTVIVVKGSGNAALDDLALDHIRRAAPYPQAPDGGKHRFSFEFVSKG